ncbi:hypothetical protein VTK26DRAFT_563 [Humicola hyalothermophila]
MTRRFLISLRYPFSHQARTSPLFQLINHGHPRRLDGSCLSVARGGRHVRAAALMALGGGLFRDGVQLATAAICLELITRQIKNARQLLKAQSDRFSVEPRTNRTTYLSTPRIDIQIIAPPALFREPSILDRSGADKKTSDAHDIGFLLQWCGANSVLPSQEVVQNATKDFVNAFIVSYGSSEMWKEAGYDVVSVPLRRITFWSDPLATPDHKTEESHNATEDYWRSFQPSRFAIVVAGSKTGKTNARVWLVGNGWISVPDHEKYTLPRPLTHGNTTTGYFISMYHQLHCLHNIMTKYNQLSDAYDRALAGDLTPLEDSSFSSSSSSSSSHHHHHARALTHDPSPSETRFLRRHFHVDHCIRYLRQALLCCGDTTLEGMNPAYDEAAAFDALDRDFVAVSDGTGMVHACKDHERIREWAEGRRVDDEWVT